MRREARGVMREVPRVQVVPNAWLTSIAFHRKAYTLERSGRRRRYSVAANSHHRKDTIVHQQRVHKLCSARSSERLGVGLGVGRQHGDHSV